MSSLMEKTELIDRVHQLIKRRGTGTPVQLAERLDVSKATVFRLIEAMKALEAPIVYDFSSQTYVYEHDVSFSFGFIAVRDLYEIEGDNINGGFSDLKYLNFIEIFK